jgi:hypothetical protein
VKKWAVAVVLGLSLVGLTACKEVDIQKANATLVTGTDSLYWFCDGTTLIYFEDVDGSDDEYVAFFSWGCDPQGKPTKELPGHLGEDGDK